MAKKEKETPVEGAEPTREELAAQIEAERQAPAPEPTPVPSELKRWTGSDGTVYEAEDMEGLLAKVGKAREDATLTIKDRERQIYELRRSQEKPATPEPTKADAFDKKKYYELMEEDPIKAAEYMEGVRFGSDLKPTVEKLRELEEKSALEKEGMRFYAETGYGKIETPEVNALFKQHHEAKGRTKTANDLLLTFYELERGGLIPKAGAEPSTRVKAPPLSATGGGGPAPAAEPNYDAMSRAELREAIMKQASQKPN